MLSDYFIISLTRNVQNQEKIKCCICRDKESIIRKGKFYGWSIVECQRCGLQFVSPRPNAGALSKLYVQEYFKANAPSATYQNYIKNRRVFEKDFQARIRLIEKYKKPGSLLEIGCATGFFLNIAQKRGWKVLGIDISKYASAYARRVLQLPVKTGTLESTKLKPKQFDVVVMWDTIEHLPNPAITLLKINQLLRPGGLLAFTTGINKDLVEKLSYGFSMWYVPPYHLYFFNKKAMISLLRKTGFSLIKLSIGKDQVSSLANNFFLYKAVLSQFLKKIVNPIDFIKAKHSKRANIGTAVIIVARKE